MSRLWLAAFGAAAVIACGDDNSDGGPNDNFPDVAGVYEIHGEFDGVDPSQLRFDGTMTIEQESLESSLLTGTADITITSIQSGNTFINDAELLDASVDLAGEVVFSLQSGSTTWDFIGNRHGDVLDGTHSGTIDGQSLTGTWTAERQ
ncbi:MAG TPA: hypothetical protein VH764_18275 [Gemmatimonadales bacterium]|jgi:hypothetical protein